MNERHADLSIKPFDCEKPTVNLRCSPLRQATVWLLVKPVHFTMLVEPYIPHGAAEHCVDAQLCRLSNPPHATTVATVQSNEVYLAHPAPLRLSSFGAAPDKRYSLGHTGTAGAPPRHNKTAQKPRRNDNWNFPPANNNTADTAQMRNFKFLPRELTMHLTKAFVAILFIISSTTTSANTLTSTTIVPAFNGGIFNLTPIKGLHQFDTSLGTITGVQFRVEFPFSVQSQIHNIEVLDIAKPHRLEAKVGFQISLADDRGRLFASHVGNPIGISCQGQGSISCSDALIGAHSDYFYQQDDITERIINSTSLQDYLGTGDVQVIRLGLFHFNQPNFRHLNFQTAQNINISNASASISFSMAPATVAIDYFYSPVPMPPASWLTIVGLLAIGVRKYIGKPTRMSIHNDISRR